MSIPRRIPIRCALSLSHTHTPTTFVPRFHISTSTCSIQTISHHQHTHRPLTSILTPSSTTTTTTSWLAFITAFMLSLTTASIVVCAQDEDNDLYRRLHSVLKSATSLLAEHDKLPRSSWFGRDQQSNDAEMNGLLDQAVRILKVSGLDETRAQLELLRQRIDKSKEKIAEYQHARVLAPVSSSIPFFSSLPGSHTQSYYENAIASEQQNIAEWERLMVQIKEQFIAQAMSTLGDRPLLLTESSPTLTRHSASPSDDAALRDAIESMLDTISGDDLMEMVVVCNNVKRVTEVLERLTEQSGENLETAQKYYGMYVILIRAIDHIQRRFISTIDDTYIPQLRAYRDEALQTIQQAQDAMRYEKKEAMKKTSWKTLTDKIKITSGKDADETSPIQSTSTILTSSSSPTTLLTQNIASNRMTIRVIDQYIEYLEAQRRTVAKRNHDLQLHILTALNTYKTVRLSYHVSQLMHHHTGHFHEIMSLQLPTLRGFHNAQIRDEYRALTQRIHAQTKKSGIV